MSDESPVGAASRSGNPRQTVLLFVLVLMIIALGYDYRVARPGVNDAYDKITQKSMQVNANSTETLTNLGVRELLGMEPSEILEEPNGDMVEVFKWRSGLPIRTHDLYSVYKKNGDDWLFYRHSKFERESSSDVSAYDVKGGIIVEASGTDVVAAMPGGNGGDADSEEESAGDESTDEDQSDAEASDSDATSGDEGSNSTTGSGEPPAAEDGIDPFAGSSAFDPEYRARAKPEAAFSEYDKNEDGKLVADEIPQFSSVMRKKIDQDGDGVLTKEEWMAEFKPTAEESSESSESSNPSESSEGKQE